MSHLLIPSGNGRKVPLNNVSKAQLARTVNEQAADLRLLRQQTQITGRILIAITLEPEAFDYRSGRVRIDQAALGRVQSGMDLTFTYPGDGSVLLGVVKPEDKSPIVEVPTIVGVN